MSTSSKIKYCFVGGGSGGHISAAQAIIDEFVANEGEKFYKGMIYVGSNVAMVGDKSGLSIEARRFADAQFKFLTIRAAKLQRKFDWSQFKLVFKLIAGIYDSFNILRAHKPQKIISTGGFVSVPLCLAAWVLQIPIYLHEQTAAVGLANKIVSRLATKVMISFESSKDHFPAHKTQLTGNPVRKGIFNKDSNTDLAMRIKKVLKANPKKKFMFITGGGQGSHKINMTILNSLPELTKKWNIFIQTGANETHKDIRKFESELSNYDNLIASEFYEKEDAGFLFNNADLVIARAGANTVYELGVVGTPAILIPLSFAANNEQYKNAKVLEDSNLAVIIQERELSKDTFLNAVDDSSSLKMGQQVFQAYAAKKIYSIFERSD